MCGAKRGTTIQSKLIPSLMHREKISGPKVLVSALQFNSEIDIDKIKKSGIHKLFNFFDLR